MNPRTSTPPRPAGPSRRTVLGVSVAGAAGLLTACGGGSDTTDAGGGSSSGASSESSKSGASGSSGSSGGGALVKTADVPVGNGVILTDQKVVVVQPTKGDFKAFSAICTHMHCTVGTIKNGTISCPCHGSTYSAKDGSVTGGPAPRALDPIAVTVQGDEVVKS